MSEYAKYVEHDDAPRFEGSYNRRYVYGLVFNITLGGFFFGYAMATFSPVKNFVETVAFGKKLDAGLISLMTSFVPLGAAVGALSAGTIASKIGRKRAAFLIDILSIIGTILTILPNEYFLLVGRLLQGLCVGANSSLVPLFINEVAPIEASGTLGTFNQLQICIGVIAAPIIALGMPSGKDLKPYEGNHYYQVVLGCAAIAPIARLILTTLFFKYDTPRYLVSTGNDVEAHTILSLIYGDTRAQNELVNLKRQKDQESQSSKLSMKDIIGPKYRRRLLVGVAVAVFQQLSGINAIIMFSNQIFEDAGAPEGSTLATVYTIITDFLQIVGCLIAGLIIERLGRRILLIGGLLVLAVFIGTFGLISYLDPSSGFLKFLIWGYILVFGLSIGPIPWIYIADILPDIAIGLAVLGNWTTVFAIGMGFDPLKKATNGVAFPFLLFAVLSVLGAGFMSVFAKETKGKNQNEIDELFVKKDDTFTYDPNTSG